MLEEKLTENQHVEHALRRVCFWDASRKSGSPFGLNSIQRPVQKPEVGLSV